MDSLSERWLPAPGIIGYEVSNRGNVRSFRERYSLGIGKGASWRITTISRPIKTCINAEGYAVFGATVDAKVRQFKTHRLVLEAFVGPCPKGMECCHQDGNPSNNILTNLQWGTPKKNADDRKRHGREAKRKGVFNPSAKLNDEAVIEVIKFVRDGWFHSFIGKLFGVTQTQISGIARKERWIHVWESIGEQPNEAA